MKKSVFTVLVILGLASVRVFSQASVVMVKPADSKLWGYANLKGEVIIAPTYDECHPFSSDGWAPVYDKKAKKFSFINVKGEKLATEVSDFRLITAPFGAFVEGFSNGFVPVKIGDSWGYLNTAGKLAIPAKYEHVVAFDGGVAVVKNGGTFSILNAKGQEVKINVPGVVDVKGFSEGLAIFRVESKQVGFLDEHGAVAIPAKFESVGSFVNHLAWARTSDKQVGYINPKGDWVIKPQFQDGKEFDQESGLARIKTGDHWAYVTTSGEIVNVSDTETWGDFSEGLADGKKGVLKGFYDKTGAWVIKPQFEGTRDFKNGYAAAKSGGRWGIIDKKGNWVVKPAFDGIRDVEVVK